MGGVCEWGEKQNMDLVRHNRSYKRTENEASRRAEVDKYVAKAEFAGADFWVYVDYQAFFGFSLKALWIGHWLMG